MISDFPTSRHHGAPKHGDALLGGLLRCRRCRGRRGGSHHRRPARPGTRGALRDLEAARYAAADGVEPWLNLTRAAKLLGISQKTLRLAAEGGEIDAVHRWLMVRGSSAVPISKHIGADDR